MQYKLFCIFSFLEGESEQADGLTVGVKIKKNTKVQQTFSKEEWLQPQSAEYSISCWPR